MTAVFVIVLGLAAQAPAPRRAIVVDFQSSGRGFHPCLIAAALKELEASPGARVVGIGLPSKTLVDWEELAPGVRVGPLRSSNGLQSMQDLCDPEAAGHGGIRTSTDSVLAALGKAYAGRGPVELIWLDDERKVMRLTSPEGTPDSSDLLKATIALAKPSSDLHLTGGSWEKGTRGRVFALIEGTGQRSLKQRFTYDPGPASERLCFPLKDSAPARVVIFDEGNGWLGLATVQ